MKSQKLAGRYANALYEFAVQENKLEETYQDILTLKEVFHENHDLKAVIESPVITPDKKKNIFSTLFEQKINAVSYGFLSLIIKKKREPALLMIFDEFIRLYNKHHNIRIAQFTTAVAISDALAERIKAVLEEQTKSTIQLQRIVNPELIGGFIVKIDDFLVDTSLIGRINKLKQEFENNVYQAGF